MFTYSISNNHYNRYTKKESKNVSDLLKDLATKCVSPVTIYSESELTNVDTGKVWTSKQHRSNATIKERGNLGMIDFEGKHAKLTELLNKMESRKLFYVAIPSQSNKSDKRNARFHIMYLLSEPYTINSEAYKIQAKAFFEYINFKWDESDSGIDTRASFNGCGYFAPTIQLSSDAGKGAKKISSPYLTLDDIAKDILMSTFKEAYTPEDSTSDAANEVFSSVTKRGKRIRGYKTIKIVRTLAKGYVLSSDTHIETTDGRHMTFERLVDALHEVEGENPRISMLGCPICNEDHTAASTIGYAYMQFDSADKPYIMCTGNACESRPYFTMAEGNTSVYRVDDAAGVSKYVMFEDDAIVYTHDRDMTYKFSPEALSDELLERGYGEIVDGKYSRGATIGKYIIGASSIQINNNPFAKEGIDIYNRTFTLSPPSKFEPSVEDADEVISEAIKAFEDDAYILGYPISLIYISYYLFHHKQIMAVLFLVNADRGSGKSFWVLELPQWFLGQSKVSGMGSSAISAGWDDEKFGKRVVVYEDVEHLTKQELGVLKSDIKSDATSGDSKFLNLKGIGKRRSFGFNSAGTSNHFDQIPFDGAGDRRIYPSPYKMLDCSQYLSSKLSKQSKTMERHRTNAINLLYKIYTECEASGSKELETALYYKVPISSIRGIVEDSTSTDGHTALNIIRRGTSTRGIIKDLANIVASDVNKKDLKDIIEDMEFQDETIKISGKTLHELWKILPRGKDSMKSVNHRALLKIFGIDAELKSTRVHGVGQRGVTIRRTL